MPVYNGARYLRFALDSLLAQTLPDFELLISDNASTDDTERICLDYAARDPRMRYHRAPVNRGAGWNFNAVAARASSEFFAWAAHDDEWHPQFLEKCSEVLLQRPNVALCYGRFQAIDESGNEHGPVGGVGCTGATTRERWNYMLQHWEVHASVYGLMRTAALRRTRGMLAFHSSDQVFMTELALQGELVVLDEVLHKKRIAPQKPYRTRAELLKMLGANQRRPWLLLRKNIVREQVAGLRHVSNDRSQILPFTLDAWRHYAGSKAWLSDGLEAAQQLFGIERVNRIRTLVGR